MKLRVLLFLCLSLIAVACGGGAADDPVATDTGAAATGEPTDMTEPTGTAAPTTGTETEGAAGDRSDWPDELVLGLVPSREAGALVESAEPLAAALEEALGISNVEPFVPTDYTALTEAMASGQADIGAFGPLGIVRAQDRAGAEFILQSERFGSLTYHTQYMTNDPDTYCLDEVVTDEEGFSYCNGTMEAEEGPVGGEAIAMIEAGTALAYVDPTSTSGFLIPSLQMLQQGVPIDDLESTFAGGHDAAVIAVVNGDVEIGLSFDDARSEVVEQFPDVGEQAVVFAYSQEIPNDGIVVRGELPESLKEAITQSLLDYASSDEGVEVLGEIYNIEGLVPAEEGVLDVVREADEEFGETFTGEG